MVKTSFKLSKKFSLILLGFKVPFLLKTLDFRLRFYNTPNAVTSGITSRCMDGRHVLFLDYDNQELVQVEDEVKFLQEKFNLGNAYVFRTRDNGFHTIFLDKMPLVEAYNIMKETNCDYAFK